MINKLTQHFLRHGSYFGGHLLPFGRIRAPESGYHLHAGGKWSQDYLIVDVETYQNASSWREVSIRRVREVFPRKTTYFPAQTGKLKSMLDDSARRQRQWDESYIEDSDGYGDEELNGPPMDAETPDAAPSERDDDEQTEAADPEGDFWELRDFTLIRHHTSCRYNMFSPLEAAEDLPLPLSEIDVMRKTQIDEGFGTYLIH